MFKFNELSILNNILTIDVQIEDKEEYKDLWIDSITVSNQATYNDQSTRGEKTLYIPNDSLLTSAELIESDIYNTEYEFSSRLVGSEEVYSIGKAKFISTEQEGTEDYWTTIEILENKDPETGEDIGDLVGTEVKLRGTKDSITDGESQLYYDENTPSDIFMKINKTINYCKHIRLILDNDMFKDLTDEEYNLKDLLFIYVTANGNYEAACNEKIYIVHPVVDMLPFYCRGMNFVKSLGDTCNIPREFIDYILMYKAFELSLYTGNYPNAIQYFNDFKRVRSNSGIQIKQRRGGGCGCH